MNKNQDAIMSVQDREVTEDTYLGEKQGTLSDVEHMRRMGKEQVFRRNFNFLSIFGFAMILMNTWQALLGVVAFGLANGGSAGLIYMYIAVIVLFGCTNISMAEMASMAPTAGGQYHWISEFSPRSLQRVLSFYVGWLCVLGWQCGVAIGCFLAGTQIQGLIVLNNDNYVPERWHGTLLTIAIVFFIAIFNTFLAKHLPLVEGLVLCLHIGGFVAILVPLWVLGPRSSSKEVWQTFANEGGWPSLGLACLVGLLTPATAFLGADAAVHMSEELKNASKVLPRAMISTSVVNGILGFIMLITFCYTLGDIEDVLSTPTGFPFIQVFYNATRSRGGTTAMTLILTLSATANGMTNMATASRQLFAFARDRGVPFHTFFARVPQGWDIPLNAVLVTILFSCCAALVNIGSTVAFNQVLSLGICALLGSYFISIACIAWRRITNMPLLPSHFSLGKWGLPLNLVSLAFLLVTWAFSFFPPFFNPPPEGMNYSSAVFGGVMLLATIHYFTGARHVYVGPVEYVRKSD